MARDYKKMLYVLLKEMSMSGDEIEGAELEKRYGKEYRDFYCEYEVGIYKPRIKTMLKFYPVPMVVGAIHQLFQGYHIASDTEDELYSIADPKGKWNKPSEYEHYTDETNPLLSSVLFETKDESIAQSWAREAAADYFYWNTDIEFSCSELADLQDHFRKLGTKYGLLEEFEKEGVC